ncbi:MAG: ATPase [Bdellovibrionaceae bacterium]|nr:ATPase [Pseudobdellovibrionaceae bacterium]|tara:strand:+ start:98285 stop:99334 length:1050 start_codon:yes stop_codon:yes gene_type:complete
MSNAPSCHSSGCHDHSKTDYLLWGSLALIALGYVLHLVGLNFNNLQLEEFSHSVYELMNKMAIGLVLAIFFTGLVDTIPQEFTLSLLGTGRGFKGLLRATAAGLLLDLCSHGILLVGMKLYKRGATLGQTMAFLIASPWNSFSMTIILITLIGWVYTLVFIVLSCVIAILSGLIFNSLESKNVLPKNPHTVAIPEGYKVLPEAKKLVSQISFSPAVLWKVILSGAKESKMILRWVFFGVIIAALVRVLFTPESFGTWFGPSLLGLGLTIVAATIIEVCSEGSAPIAAELLTVAKAPGNGFTFMMTGVSTDYTEIMALKETTGSWKISLFLPLVTVPQVVALGWILNNYP